MNLFFSEFPSAWYNGPFRALAQRRAPLLAFFLSVGALSTPAFCSPLETLPIEQDHTVSTAPLTTDLLLELDPGVEYPHRTRWALSRTLTLRGLKTRRFSPSASASPQQKKPALKRNRPQEAVSAPESRYGVQALALSVRTEGYLRPPGGPWYSDLKEFSCHAHPEAQFQTATGAEQALKKAVQLWSQRLEESVFTLTQLFSQIQESSEPAAMERAQIVFARWKEQLDSQWKTALEKEGRKAEWKTYQAQAKELKICPRKGPAPRLRSWAEQMEPVVASQQNPRLLARAPVRLWRHWPTLRVDIGVAGKTLNGRFLLDPLAPKSVLSQSWLENQGIFPLWVLIPTEPLQRIHLSLPFPAENHLARVAEVDSLSVAGLSVPLRHFLLKDLELFSPPEFVAPCCDGVLGADFFTHYSVEISNQTPPAAQVWSREHYQGPPGSSWFEQGELTAQQLPFSGKVILDFPHGRVWVPPGEPDPRRTSDRSTRFTPNLSGLHVSFQFKKGDRVLTVEKLTPHSVAEQTLKPLGLRPGMELIRIQEQDPSDIDLSQVEDLLNTPADQPITIQWKRGQAGSQQGSYQLKPKEK
jgi:hypothetical protein